MHRKPIIYQLVVRYFGNTKLANQWNGSIVDNGCGKFDDISSVALDSLRQLGVTHVWLTGCLRQASLTDYSAYGIPPDDPDAVKGIAGSFYAVRDYFDVCPDYATDVANRLAEIDSLVARVHAAGMKALIDFVPNHVARGYHSILRPDLDFGSNDDTSQFFQLDNSFFYLVDPPGHKLTLPTPPHWTPPAGFVLDGAYALEDGTPGRPPKATGNNVTSAEPRITDWYETVKINYGFNFVTRVGSYEPRPRTWEVMDEIIAYWQARGVDGFRCDFAHYVPPEAWAYLIGGARDRDAGSYFFAEAYPFLNSGDPITEMTQLLDAGFDAVYFDESYDRLKAIYQVQAGQDYYDQAMVSLEASVRPRVVQYLENHDERRIASPILPNESPDNSGFGSSNAGYQLAPLQYLYSSGPVLILNGQEVGEPAAGAEGYGGDDGRTTLFDYWCMPELAKWVNGHAFDGGGLSVAQKSLRRFYADLFALCQDASVCSEGYWGLKYFNRPENFADSPNDLYSFARFQSGSGRLLLIVANFQAGSATEGRIRIPPELADAAALAQQVTIRLRLDDKGAQDLLVTPCSRQELVDDGFMVAIPNQSATVYLVE